jgi:2-polyprenyl-3-methyl-5-hydroxy-6-metoxy-1,4-benzoquinol methylase
MSPTRENTLFEEIACPLCGANDYAVIKPSRYPAHITAQDLSRSYSASSAHELLDQVVRCRQCTMQYVNPRPRADLIIDSYAAAEDPTFVAQNEGWIHTFKKYLGKVLAIDGRPAGGRQYLDIGCAGGASLVAARELGFQPSGVEPSRWMADFGRRTYGVEIRDGILVPGMFPEASFDVIAMWDVLEHVPDPRSLLSLICTLLRPGGVFVVTYPDVGSWTTRLLGHRWPFWLSVHLLYYERPTIRRQLEGSGLRVKAIKPYLQTLPLGYVLRRATPYVPPAGWVERLVSGVGLQDLPLTYHAGQTIVVSDKPIK